MAHKPFSAETISKLRQRGKAQIATTASRRAHGDLTKARIAAAAPFRADLVRLRDAWALARPSARARFLAEITGARE